MISQAPIALQYTRNLLYYKSILLFQETLRTFHISKKSVRAQQSAGLTLPDRMFNERRLQQMY